MKTSAGYIGRFAPSPTGPLHLGSLLCALISYLDAKANKGQWLLRIDDLDQPRVDAKHSASIISTLQTHGFDWDQDIVYQSKQNHHYQQAFEILQEKKAVFPCALSRRDLRTHHSGIHIGKSIAQPSSNAQENAWRADLGELTVIEFEDDLLGRQRVDLSEQGAFAVKRREGLFAYHFACVVDDYLSGVTHIVRGHDLLESTAAQIFLQQQLDYPRGHYAHHFLIANSQGQKLSKQHMAEPVNDLKPFENLLFCLRLIDLEPKECFTSVSELLEWAVKQWSLNSIRGKKQVILNSDYP